MCVCAKDASPIPMNFSEKHSNAFMRMRNDRALVTNILQKRAEVNPTHQSLREREREVLSNGGGGSEKEVCATRSDSVIDGLPTVSSGTNW